MVWIYIVADLKPHWLCMVSWCLFPVFRKDEAGRSKEMTSYHLRDTVQRIDLRNSYSSLALNSPSRHGCEMLS
jgi:hypothetical protein